MPEPGNTESLLIHKSGGHPLDKTDADAIRDARADLQRHLASEGYELVGECQAPRVTLVPDGVPVEKVVRLAVYRRPVAASDATGGGGS